MTILYFIIVLGVLIFIHELGHFILAKRAGIFVEVFSLGFGPRIIGFKGGDTDYRISAFPLGGYVKMHGEEPDDEAGRDPRSFANKSVWARVKVILWGPLMNLMLCLALMPVVFMLGRSEPAFLSEPPKVIGVKSDSPAAGVGIEEGDLVVSVDGKSVAAWDDVINKILLSPKGTLDLGIERNGAILEKRVKVGELPEVKGGYLGIEPMLFIGAEPRIDGVRKGGPAEVAGLKPGDLVVSFEGKEVPDWLELTKFVNDSAGKSADIVVERDGKKIDLTVTAAFNDDFQRWVIGISKDRSSGLPMIVKRYGFWGAIVKGTQENIKLTRLTFDVLGRLVTNQLSYRVLGGPIMIAKSSAAAAASGLSGFLYFMAFLSLQLSILNLLPIPVLDGGQLVFLGIEGLIRRPVSIKVRAVAQHVGFVLLIGFMLLVTFNDIDNIWGIRAFLHKLF